MKNVVPPTQRLGAFDICIRLLARKYNLLVTNDLISEANLLSNGHT